MWGIPFIRRCFVSRISGGRLGRWPRIYSNSKFSGVTLKRGRRREVGPHEEFVLTRRTQDAASPKNEKSPVLATIQGTLALIAAAKRMRRLYGSRGGSARQDGSVAADADLSSEDEDDHAARFAYRKATREKDFAKKEDNEGGQGKSKGENGGPSPNGGDRRTEAQTVCTVMRRTAFRRATVERCLRRPRLCGVSPRLLLTYLLRWSRRWVCRMTGFL